MKGYETFYSKIRDVLKVAKIVCDVDFRTFDTFLNQDNAVKAIAVDLKN
ncbi:hypothetical protein [Methanobrevibacter sp.]